MKVSVVGTGHTRFGRDNRDIGELMLDASLQALGEVDAQALDAIYISNFSSCFSGQCHLPAVLASKLGVGMEITRVESACASGGLALKEAALAILSGMYEKVLVVGAERMSALPIETTTAVLTRAAGLQEARQGVTFPGLYALMARRHFHEYGTTEEHLAKIAVKGHANAHDNPMAQFHKAITVDDVMRSRPVSSPLKMLDCSPVSDGAAALLLCSPDVAREYSDDPVNLVGIGHDTEAVELYGRESLTTMPAVVKAARKAYDISGLKPEDMDMAEVHDCFTIAELIEVEDLGFAEKGKGKCFVDDGEGEIGGRIPINASGGLKAKGHPVGATGVSQAVETVRQLQGRADGMQIQGARTGLCCNVGGSGATAIVSIFSRWS